MPHDFREKLVEGERWELALDRFFSRWYTIERVGRQAQKCGLDRTWTRPDGSVIKVEYKADSVAASTGNVFLEVVSVDTAGKTGWVNSTQADLVVYLVPPTRQVFLVRVDTLRAKMFDWGWKYPTRTADNGSYQTHGVCVPLAEFKTVAHTAMSLEMLEFDPPQVQG